MTGSNVTLINARTIQNLDASITVMQSRGEGELAQAVKKLTEAILESNEIEKSVKNEIAEQLEFLVAQTTAEPQNRSIGIGVVKSILAGMRGSLSVSASLLTIWDRLEHLIKVALGIG